MLTQQLPLHIGVIGAKEKTVLTSFGVRNSILEKYGHP